MKKGSLPVCLWYWYLRGAVTFVMVALSRMEISRTTKSKMIFIVMLVFVYCFCTGDWKLRNCSTECHSAECCFSECRSTECHSAVSHSAKCHFAVCHSAECHSDKCHSAECHSVEYHSTECHSTECHSAEYHSTECRGVLVLFFCQIFWQRVIPRSADNFITFYTRNVQP